MVYGKRGLLFSSKENHTCKIHKVRPKTAKNTNHWEEKTSACGETWTTEQIRAVLPDFNPNNGDLYVVSKNGTVNLLSHLKGHEFALTFDGVMVGYYDDEYLSHLLRSRD